MNLGPRHILRGAAFVEKVERLVRREKSRVCVTLVFMSVFRKAESSDVERMVELSEQKRLQYQAYQPVFWRKAADSAEKQRAFLGRLLERDNVIGMVYERDGVVEGFIIGSLVPAPPVYDPGGSTCSVDDFVVAEEAWGGIGGALLEAVAAEARARGAAQMVVVSAHLDARKREMLVNSTYAIASEWWVRPLQK